MSLFVPSVASLDPFPAPKNLGLFSGGSLIQARNVRGARYRQIKASINKIARVTGWHQEWCLVLELSEVYRLCALPASHSPTPRPRVRRCRRSAPDSATSTAPTPLA